jgi:hypothetical protein
MKNLILVLLAIFTCKNTFSQTWQPIGIPQGKGVTDLVYWSGGGAVFGDKLWATTGSVDWPTGQRGGVFYSSGNGVWNRIGGSAGHYVGRTLAVGQDGNLYASLWRDPATFVADGLFKFIPQVGDFGLLYQAQAGDNIFSIAVKNNPHTIFAGTRNGVLRSTNNGTTFGYSNNGIPDSAWVYDIAIDSTGILAVASSKGIFASTDNGNNWLMAAGIAAGDTIWKLLFYNEVTQDGGSSVLMSGSENGDLYVSTEDQLYLNCAIVYSFTGGKVADLAWAWLEDANYRKHGVANFRRISRDAIFSHEGRFYSSSDNGLTWSPQENGLPPNPPVTALATKRISGTFTEFYAGLFKDTTNGAGVYKLDITVGVEETDNEIPSEYLLEQNYPNPFNPSTTIQFSIPEQTFVKLEVFNTLGEKIATLVSEELSAGNYKYDWDAADLPSGVYLYRLQTAAFSISKKMILLR